MAYAIITESGLSYLGFGVQPPTPSWGNLLATAQVYALRAPWLMIFPGLMIFITTLAINHIGDGLRDAFDPVSAALIIRYIRQAVSDSVLPVPTSFSPQEEP